MAPYLLIVAVVSVIIVCSRYKSKIMTRMGNPLFTIGYMLYSKTRLGYLFYRRELSKARAQLRSNTHSIASPVHYDKLVVIPIAMAMDNYAFLIHDGDPEAAVLVDPADPAVVQSVLDREGITPVAILTTHRHWDHSAGNRTLKRRYPSLKIYGGVHDTRNLIEKTNSVSHNDRLHLGGLSFTVYHTPGHTIEHVVYLLDGAPFNAPPCLFSGDVLFRGGIGRVFEGSPECMLRSLDCICKLPDETLIFPGHEYAENNLQFASALEPDNATVQEQFNVVNDLRIKEYSTCPSSLAQEKAYNPFLRLHTPEVLNALGISIPDNSDGAVVEQTRILALKRCRKRKDSFKYTFYYSLSPSQLAFVRAERGVSVSSETAQPTRESLLTQN